MLFTSQLLVSTTLWQCFRRCQMILWRSMVSTVGVKYLTQSPVMEIFWDSNSSRTKRYRKLDLLRFIWPTSTSVLRTMEVVSMSVETPSDHMSARATTVSLFTKTDMTAKKAVASSRSHHQLVTSHHQTTPTYIQHKKIAFGTSQRLRVIVFDLSSMCLKSSHIKSVLTITLRCLTDHLLKVTAWDAFVDRNFRIQYHQRLTRCLCCSTLTRVFIEKDSSPLIQLSAADICKQRTSWKIFIRTLDSVMKHMNNILIVNGWLKQRGGETFNWLSWRSKSKKKNLVHTTTLRFTAVLTIRVDDFMDVSAEML